MDKPLVSILQQSRKQAGAHRSTWSTKPLVHSFPGSQYLTGKVLRKSFRVVDKEKKSEEEDLLEKFKNFFLRSQNPKTESHPRIWFSLSVTLKLFRKDTC